MTGRIVGFSDDSRMVIVEHEEVAGLMPAMTMPFRTIGSDELNGLVFGDRISFRLHVTQDSSWIDGIEKLPETDLPTPPLRTGGVVGPTVLLPGETVPALTLIDQSGEAIEFFSRPASEVYIINFVYTRCPIPEFCPLLSRKFGEIQVLIRSNSVNAVHLVTVTVDPAFDSPSVLREYARRNSASADTWNFYTGEQSTLDSLYTYFGVSLFESPEQPVAHPLAAAVVRGDGRLLQIWRDSEWSPAEVLARAQRSTADETR